MEIHHSKHHQAYIAKYNAAIEGSSLEQKRVFDVLADFSSVSDDIKGAVRNNGGVISTTHCSGRSLAQTVVGHQLKIWRQKLIVHSEVLMPLSQNLQMLQQLVLAAVGRGYCRLNGKLAVTSTPNQDSPVMEGLLPILGLDV